MYRSCLLQIAIFQLWVDEFSKTQKQKLRAEWELILSVSIRKYYHMKSFYATLKPILGVKIHFQSTITVKSGRATTA